MRLDYYLLTNKGIKSRNFAQELIKEGLVKVDNKTITKAAYKVAKTANVEITTEYQEYVSRGAYKLKKALEAFNIDLNDKTVLDIGASTGGFTQICLEAGCALIYAVDVGKNQLALKLRNNPLVIVKENTDIRTINKQELVKLDFICCDVSFISALLILPKISELAKAGCDIIILFKPQFEVGPSYLNKQGVVKDKTRTAQCLTEFINQLPHYDLKFNGQITSPILGKSGNEEYLLYLQKTK